MQMWNPTAWLLMLMNGAGVCETIKGRKGRHIQLKLRCVCACMCVCVCESLNKPAHNLADSPRPWAGCYHGNLSQYFFGPHFPFEQPANDRPADWEIWLTESACTSCESACACLSEYVRACIIRAWYRSREIYNLLAPHRFVMRVLRWQLAAQYCAWHIGSGQFYFQEDAAMCQVTERIFQIWEWSERSRGKR